MKKILFIILIIVIGVISCQYLTVKEKLNFFPTFKDVYYASDFNIKVVKSSNDHNNNGIDDYTDILIGARKDAEAMPVYRSAYYAGGYPPDDEGVCTDLVWRAFKEAGYILKDMVDADINKSSNDYPGLDEIPDPNIDFRRVVNLKVFFDKYATSYSLDIYDIEEWQPGDIVIFEPEYKHIGIISDKRNKEGIPYLIHNTGQMKREEDILLEYYQVRGITGHYRFEKEPNV